jgi:hypothetical protein
MGRALFTLVSGQDAWLKLEWTPPDCALSLLSLVLKAYCGQVATLGNCATLPTARSALIVCITRWPYTRGCKHLSNAPTLPGGKSRG